MLLQKATLPSFYNEPKGSGHRYREQTRDYQWGEGKGRGSIRVDVKQVIMGL